MMQQRTIAEVVDAIGIGLHSGCRVVMRLIPAPVNHGIVFKRVDLKHTPVINCSPGNVRDTRMSSTLIQDDVRVGTVEHLMSALACYGIDNLLIEISAEEIPIMDGSSNSFLYLLDQARVVEQSEKKKYIRILKSLRVELEDKWVEISPFQGFKVKLEIDFDNHPLFQSPNNVFEVDFSKHSYIDEISRARTFGFMYEIEYLLENGLGLGGNLNNVVLISEDDVINQGGMRFPNEFVRHKILDAIGDLYVIGHPIIGCFEGYKSGHALNNMLLRTMLAEPDCWEFVSFSSYKEVPESFHSYS